MPVGEGTNPMAVREQTGALPNAAAQAKRLLRISRTGALATLDRASGAPLTTWVGFASDFTGAPLFLFSEIAEHTKNLAVDPRGSVLLTDPPDRGDPLNHPRVTVGGAIAPHPDPYARKRYLQRNPKAKLYSSFADFAIYRMRVEAVHFNGGFGRAEPLTPADLLAPCSGRGRLDRGRGSSARGGRRVRRRGRCAPGRASRSPPARLARDRPGRRGPRSRRRRPGGAGRFQRARVRSAKLARAARGSLGSRR